MLTVVMENTTLDPSFNESYVTSPLCSKSSPYYVGSIGTFEFVLKCVVLPILTIGGLVGNSLCYVVLSHDKKQQSLNFLLKGLVIADNLVLVFMTLYQTVPASYGHSGFALEYKIFFENIGRSWIIFLQWTAKMVSIYLTLFVTVERYIAVSRPLKAQFICTLRNAKIGTLVIVIISTLYNVPKVFYYKWFESIYDPCMDKLMPVSQRSDLYKSKVFVDVYVLGMYFVVIYIFPLAALFIFNAFLIAMVRRSYRQRAKMGGNVSQEKCTEKIIGIVSAFIILETPAIIVNIYYSQKTELTPSDFQALNMIYILSAINSVINFYIYVLVGKAFRARLKAVLRCRKPAARSPSIRSGSESSTVITTNRRAQNYVMKNGSTPHNQVAAVDEVSHL